MREISDRGPLAGPSEKMANGRGRTASAAWWGWERRQSFAVPMLFTFAGPWSTNGDTGARQTPSKRSTI